MSLNESWSPTTRRLRVLVGTGDHLDEPASFSQSVDEDLVLYALHRGRLLRLLSKIYINTISRRFYRRMTIPRDRAPYSMTTRSPSLRPKVSGLYISSALVGGTTKSPGVVARAT